jgi:hypothetical protein
VDACVPIIEFKEKIGIQAILSLVLKVDVAENNIVWRSVDKLC